MGTVWLAERADGVLQRQVALKLPRLRLARMRPGAAHGARARHPRDARASAHRAAVRRRRHARQAARRWRWSAWTGRRSTCYCDAQRLDVPRRLRLFLQIARCGGARACAADRASRPEAGEHPRHADGACALLDFGVAKLLEDDGMAPSLTQLMGRAVTPDYASPEQVACKPVTVATDIYSLGVVLYELLTGQRPYQLGRRERRGARGGHPAGRRAAGQHARVGRSGASHVSCVANSTPCSPRR